MSNYPQSPMAVNVPVVQPGVVSAPTEVNPEWTQNYCCSQSFGNCLFSWLCAPCAAADARARFDGSNRCFNLLAIGCCYPTYHNIIREGYGISGTCIGDILCGLCCGPCAVTRMRGEVLARGGIPVDKKDASSRWAKDPLVACLSCPRVLALLLGPFYPLYMMWTFAKARTDMDGSNCLFNFFCVPPCVTMNVIREGYGIEGTWLSDVIYISCFPCLASAMLAEHVNTENK